MKRPFKTDYAGAWAGHCMSRESAIIAAIRHVVNDGYNKATITDKRTDEDVARVRLSKDRLHAVVDLVDPIREIGRL